MNRIIGLVLLALLGLPTAAGLSLGVTRETHAYAQTGDTIGAIITLEIKVGDAAAQADPRVPSDTGFIEVYAPGKVTDVLAEYRRAGEPAAPLSWTMDTNAPPSFERYLLNITAERANHRAGSSFNVSLSFHVEADGFLMRTRYASGVLVILTQPQAGFQPSSGQLPEFIRINATSYHAIVPQAANGFSYGFTFVPAQAPAPAVDLTQWTWAVGGVVVGFLLAYSAFQRGWLGAPKAKRFVKGGQMESRAMLEARRRTLLAALKELEAAHDAREVPDDVHGALKEEYKAQAVRVMRTLEEKKDEPKS